MNKKGFTLVEIMIVMVIIGLLAAIGIPTIVGAYGSAMVSAKARNVGEVEKAKGVLTLPSMSGALGAISAGTATSLTFGPGLTALLSALRISDVSELAVGNSSISVGDMNGTKASYAR